MNCSFFPFQNRTTYGARTCTYVKVLLKSSDENALARISCDRELLNIRFEYDIHEIERHRFIKRHFKMFELRRNWSKTNGTTRQNTKIVAFSLVHSSVSDDQCIFYE